jgi:S-adenosylmethionine hydrolase
MPRAIPIITLTTDFGLADSYVAQMKGRILAKCPNAVIVDVTHLVPRHDVLAGSIALERALAAFGPGTIHVAVVDPGVGSDRKLLVANIAGQTVLCPDNGLITWAIRRLGRADVRE